jgi:L-amino acid N-acyltransferase YncA
LHERFGYRTIGVLDEVGHKMGEYWSTMILEKRFDTEGDGVG